MMCTSIYPYHGARPHLSCLTKAKGQENTPTFFNVTQLIWPTVAKSSGTPLLVPESSVCAISPSCQLSETPKECQCKSTCDHRQGYDDHCSCFSDQCRRSGPSVLHTVFFVGSQVPCSSKETIHCHQFSSQACHSILSSEFKQDKQVCVFIRNTTEMISTGAKLKNYIYIVTIMV